MLKSRSFFSVQAAVVKATLFSLWGLPVSAQAPQASSMPAVAPTSAANALKAFARAADRRDVPALETILHPAFRVVFTSGAGGAPVALDRAQYLQMVRDGKVGGADRTVTVQVAEPAGAFVAARAVMERPDAVFEGVYTLVQRGTEWQLLQEAVAMRQRKVP